MAHKFELKLLLFWSMCFMRLIRIKMKNNIPLHNFGQEDKMVVTIFLQIV